MSKKVVVISGLIYPVFMGRFFWDALDRRDDLEVYSTGPFFGDFVPWFPNGFHFPKHYVKTPSFPLPRNLLYAPIPYEAVENQLPDNIDLFLQCDAGWHFTTRPKAKVVALIETDPHVIPESFYKPAENYSDVVFGMQNYYLRKNQVFLPYAVDDNWFYPEKREMIHDACLIGLHYPQRDHLVREIRATGKNVYYDIGVIYNEYRHKYNESRVAISWSSLKDLPSRNWEALGMQRSLVTNHIPDMDLFFKEGEHYLGFDNVQQGKDAVMYMLEHPDKAEEMATAGYKVIVDGNHNYDSRIQFILEKCGVI